MAYMFTVSPDFTPDHLSGWYIFNTWLQKQTGVGVHLEIYDNFQNQRNAINEDKIDLIYANPFDAAILVREKGFKPLVKPKNCSDEAIIAVKSNSPVTNIAELKPGLRVAFTDDPDVRMMGMIMLEPANLDASNSEGIEYDNYVLVAKHLLKNDCEAGIFLAEAFDDLSALIKGKLKILVRSQIGVIHHSLMVGPKLAERQEEFKQLLVNMLFDEKGKGVLASLGFTGWDVVDDEEMEFSIDLMETLQMQDV